MVRAIAGAFIFVFAGHVGAQTPSGDLVHCGDTDADTSITACTALIGSAGQSDDALGKAYTYRGFSYLKKNQYDSAIGDFSQAIKLDPGNAWALANRGNAYFNKHQQDRALEDYNAALAVNSVGYATLFYGRGSIYSGRGEYDRAIADLSEAIRQKPDFPEAFRNRGNSYYDNGQFSHAIDDYNQALQLRPVYLSALQGRGNAFAALGQYDRAIEDYDKAGGVQPGAAVFQARGNAYRAKGESEKALRDFDSAIRLATSPAALGDRGDMYLELGQSSRALEDLAEGVRLGPDDPGAYLSKGRAEFYLGKWDDAAADFQKSLSLDPANPYAFIWLHFAGARAGKDDARSVEQQLQQLRLAEWPAPIVNLLLGKIKPATAIALASDADPDKKMSQQCEAEFYVGEYLLTQRDKEGAVTHLERARGTCSHVFPEWLGAKLELIRTSR